MTGGWSNERAAVAGAFDVIAPLYRREFAGELAHKAFDRAFLERAASLVPVGGPVLEVGAGPGHVGAYLTSLGVAVVCSDASTGQLRQARLLDAGTPLVAADLMRLPVGAGSLAGVLAFYCLIYGPVAALDAVFADWHEALVPGGLVAAAFHAGDGTRVHTAEWEGDSVEVTVVLRDPEDVVRRMANAGLDVLETTVRPSYDEESDTERAYVLARPASS